MYSVFQRHRGKFLILSLLVMVAATLAYRAVSTEAVIKEAVVQENALSLQAIDQSLTIGEVTVTLEQIRHSPDTLGAKYSYHTSDPKLDIDPMINGFNVTRADGSVNDFQYAVRTEDGSEIINFDIDSKIPGGGENVNVSLGSYITHSQDITGSVAISLGTEYATALSKENETNGPVRVPLNAELVTGNKRYRISEMLVFPQTFRLWVYPANEAARSTVWGVIAQKATATLTDNTGASYEYLGGDASFDDLSPRGQEWQQFIFSGRILPSVSSLTLTIRGGGEIVGPFVFDNIALVSEDIPPVTPVPPGGVGPGDPIPTPPNAND